MNDSYKIPLSIHLLKDKIETSPVHTFILWIDLREVIFNNFFSRIDIEDIIDDVSSIKFLVMIDFRCSCKVYIVDKFLSILPDS